MRQSLAWKKAFGMLDAFVLFDQDVFRILKHNNCDLFIIMVIIYINQDG
jgi:hypothetical protein